MMEEGGSTLQKVASQQQRHGERLSILETQIKDLKTQVRSVEETLNSQFSFLCKNLGIPVPVVPSTHFTPDPGSTYAAKSKSEETKSVDEATADSHELELIPHFFFIENDDVDLLHGQFEENSKLEINCLSESSLATINKRKDIEMQFCVNFLAKISDISSNLLGLFLLHNKSLHLDCFSLYFDYIRSIFDRGKSTVISSLTYEKLIVQLLLSLGYGLGLRFINSFPRLCVTNVAILGEKKMFVQMHERDILLLVLLFAKVITIDINCENLASSKYIIVLNNKLNGDYYRIFVPELIPEHDYGSASWSHGVLSATWQMLGKMFPVDIVCLKSKNVRNHPSPSPKSLIDARVFDRGKEFGTINGCSYFTGAYEFSLGSTGSCLFVLDVCSIVRNGHNVNFVYPLIIRHGFRSHSSSMDYILLVFKTGDIGDVFLRCLQMLAMCRTVIFLLQLGFGLSHEIAVHSIGSLVVTQIHLGSFVFIFEFIMFNTLTTLHHGFLYLQSWSLLRLVLWLPMDQLTWCNQLAGTCAFVSHDTSQMIHVISPAGDYSYEHLIFLLLPRLGYHSNFLAIRFIVLLCVTDTDIVDKRKLNVTVAARCEFLGNLAECVMWRWNCGNADFVLRLTLGQSLRRGTDITTSEFCVNTLVESMQAYPYPADLRSPYYAGLTSYGCCRLLRLANHTMRGYIKFEFLGEVVRTQRWVTMYYTPHVLVCVDAHILLKLLTLNSTKGLFFMDACASKSAHESMLEIGHHLVLQFGILHVFGFVLNG